MLLKAPELPTVADAIWDLRLERLALLIDHCSTFVFRYDLMKRSRD